MIKYYCGDKMRVISGKYKGRFLLGFDINGTRPTMDRVKESFFAMIQSKIKDSIVLDLFAGSGALGIEALSNGAKECFFVDHGDVAIKTINSNLNNLNIEEKYNVLKLDYKTALKQFIKNNNKFDLIFLDPPYINNYMDDILKTIYNNDLLSDNGYIICEYEKIFNTTLFSIYKEKKYGDKYITILKKD